MAKTKCDISILSQTKYEVRNQCLPAGYNGWVDFTPYVESDIESAYNNETIDGIKANSQINEEYTATYSKDITISAKPRIGTYFSEYVNLVSNWKQTVDTNIENTFEYRSTNGIDVKYYPSVNIQLNNEPLENIESKEYMLEMKIHPNSKPIITPNESYEIIGSNPVDVNINLLLEYATGDNLTLNFDTMIDNLNYSNLTYNIYDETSTLLENGLIPETDANAGIFTTTSGNFVNTMNYKVEVLVREIGYEGHEYQVGLANISPNPATGSLTVGTPTVDTIDFTYDYASNDEDASNSSISITPADATAISPAVEGTGTSASFTGLTASTSYTVELKQGTTVLDSFTADTTATRSVKKLK